MDMVIASHEMSTWIEAMLAEIFEEEDIPRG